MEKVGKEINVFSPSLYKAIDLGLPSGILWADRNIGAATSEDSGLYFQWGDTQGYTAEQVGSEGDKKYFDWSDYKWSVDGSSSNFSKYNAADSKTVLDLEDDAAHAIMGGNWRMPTFDECKELFMNTDVYLVQTDGKEIHGTESQNDDSGCLIQWDEKPTISTFKGIKFYKKGDKQTYLFVSASGGVSQGAVEGVGAGGLLWSASLISQNFSQAWSPGFSVVMADVGNYDRFNGCLVRGIMSNI